MELIKLQKVHISIAIPSNVLENCSDLRSKTQKIGQIARACVIYKVDEVIIYSINRKFLKDFSKDITLLKNILEYLDCPQYLRRFLFPKLPIFKYVGTLPPLRTPHHPIEKKASQLIADSVREGAVLFSNDIFSEIDIGIETPIRIQVPNLSPKSRIKLRIRKNGNSISGEPIIKAEIKQYWGFDIRIFKDSITQLIKKFEISLKIATSRYGTPIKKKDLKIFKLDEINKILLLFGSPHMGLFEIFKRNGLKLDELVDLIFNIAPEQGTKTIRVEEAILATLGILNSLISL